MKIIPELRFPEFEDEWVAKTLIDTADKKVKWSFTGGPFGSNLKASDYTIAGIRIIQLQNIGDGEFNDANKIYTSIDKADELLSCNIYSGDIIISKMGDPVGRACIIPEFLQRCVMASDGIRLVVNENKYSKYFIYSLINSKRIREAIEKKATGSTRKRIGLDTLRAVELIIPKLEEQKKIASCLSSLDELIAAHSQKLDLLKDHKKGLMQNLFPNPSSGSGGESVPKYRFPEFESDGDWIPDVLINLAKNGFSNGVFNDPKKVGSGYKLINVINMYTESPISENGLTLLELSSSEFEKNKVERGDIFFTRSSLVVEGIAKSNIYLGSSDIITYDGHLIRLRSNEEIIMPLFLHYLLKSNTVRKQMVAKGKTATMTTIGQSDIASVEISFPRNFQEQQKIASCLSAVDELITAQAERIAQLQQHKKGLMQGLFPKMEG
jgi:type I restriction enzyme S subunit